jgi:hypothetical protein
MKNKLFILLGVFSLIFLSGIISCDKCGPFPNKFKIIGLEWFNYKVIYSDTTHPKLMVSEIDSDTVEYIMYSIFIKPRQETYFAQNLNRWNFSLIHQAYACSPATPQTDEIIDSISITSSKDFDITHPSGNELSDLFDIIVLDYANGIDYKHYTFNDYIKTNPAVPNELVFILTAPPDVTTDFEFLVKYYQNGIDYDYFEFSTRKIVIKKE